MNSRNDKILFLLTTIEGFVALGFLFWIPSMEKNAILFGFSASRIVISGVILTMILLSGWMTFHLFIFPDRTANKIASWLGVGDRLYTTRDVFFLLIISGVMVTGVLFSPWEARLGMIRAIFERSVSIIIWMMLFSAQALVVLYLNYSERLNKRGVLNTHKTYKYALIFCVFILTFFHWLVLYLQVNIFTEIPYWYWKFRIKPFGFSDFIFLLIAFISIVVIWIVFHNPKYIYRNLALLVLTGYMLQVGFGFIEGKGFDSLRYKYMKAGHSVYTQYACSELDLIDSLTNYEELYGKDMYLDTKPPGLIVFHILIQRLSNFIQPASDFGGRYERMTQFMVYTFPLLSFILLIPLFIVSRELFSKDNALLPCVFYLFAPNVILMVLEMDQVLFPLLFMGGVLLWQQTLKKQSIGWAFASGIFIYFSLFFTFSIFPILALFGFWAFLEWWQDRQKGNFLKMVRLGLWLIAGLLISYILFKFVFNYDFFIRYQNAFASHQFHKKYNPLTDSLYNVIMLNNTEYATWIGIPLFVLFVTSSIRSGVDILRNKKTKLNSLIVAFAGTYIALNLFGQTRSEVGRLWIFILPLVCICVAEEASRLFTRRGWGILLLVILQLVTIFLTYHFQDAINL